MNNERYNQIVDEAWNSYHHQTMFDSNPKWLEPVPVMNMKTGEKSIGARQYHKNNFLAKCKTDSEFSEKWGLKIEEREWSVKERLFFVNKSNEEYEKALANKTQYESIGLDFELALTSRMNELNIPTKLITVTYKDEKIEVYE